MFGLVATKTFPLLLLLQRLCSPWQGFASELVRFGFAREILITPEWNTATCRILDWFISVCSNSIFLTKPRGLFDMLGVESVWWCKLTLSTLTQIQYLSTIVFEATLTTLHFRVNFAMFTPLHLLDSYLKNYILHRNMQNAIQKTVSTLTVFPSIIFHKKIKD